jgi:hypothetical protein
VIIISHRGFLNGVDKSVENNPIQVDKCLNLNFNVEIDVWYEKRIFYLGHNSPVHKISYRWLEDRSKFLWVHCKNLSALDFFVSNKSNLNFFFHNADNYTLTSHKFIWTYPNLKVTKNCIIVALNYNDIFTFAGKSIKPFGVCTDYPIKFKKTIVKMSMK